MDLSATKAVDAATLRIQGEMDAVSDSDLRSTVEAWVDERGIVATFSGSELIQSSDLGLGAVVFLYKKAGPQGGAATVHGLCGQPLKIVDLLCLECESTGVRKSRYAASGYLHLAATIGGAAKLPAALAAGRLMNAKVLPLIR
jgi:anti-anti-sigma regulatory factor